MELQVGINCQAPQTWRRRHNHHNNKPQQHPHNHNNSKYSSSSSSNRKTLNPKYSKSLKPYEPLPLLQLNTNYDHSHALPHQKRLWSRYNTPSFQTPDHHLLIRSLIDKLEASNSAVDVLLEDVDWSEDQFWVAVRYLKAASRSHEIFELFEKWKSAEVTRSDGVNYEKVICLLCDEGHVDEGLTLFTELKTHEIKPSSVLYSSIICGLARRGEFGQARLFLDEMSEVGFVPDSEVFRVLIEGYGKYKMYDEIGECVKRMESVGYLCDELTCNLLIREFSRGGLVKRMERVYQMALSKKLNLQPSTSVAILDAYANFGPIDKMEKMLKRVMNTNARINDSSVRKVAEVYIENFMFSRLDDLGLDLSTRSGGSADLIWCLRLLSNACLLSRKGMDSVIGAMEVAGVSWTITTANIVLFTYLKMKDFTHLRAVLYDLVTNQIKPDMVTFSVLFDAIGNGFDGARTLHIWQRAGFLSERVEMNTDSLVIKAFGKGRFLKSCEEIYSRIDMEDREGRIWCYKELIELVRRVGDDKIRK